MLHADVGTQFKILEWLERTAFAFFVMAFLAPGVFLIIKYFIRTWKLIQETVYVTSENLNAKHTYRLFRLGCGITVIFNCRFLNES